MEGVIYERQRAKEGSKVKTQGELFPSGVLLYEALQPGVERDQVGEVGERMFALAESVKNVFSTVTTKSTQPVDLWNSLAALEKTKRTKAVTGHFRALRAVSRSARLAR